MPIADWQAILTKAMSEDAVVDLDVCGVAMQGTVESIARTRDAIGVEPICEVRLTLAWRHECPEPAND